MALPQYVGRSSLFLIIGMEIGVKIIYYILLFFIRIGDGVLFVISAFFHLLNTLRALITSTFQKIKTSLKKMGQTTRSIPSHVSLSLPHLRLFHKQKKRGRPKSTRPLPYRISLFSKLRYFTYGLVFSLLFIFLPLLFYSFLQSLPHPSALTQRQIPQTTKIYDRNGILLHQIYSQQNRTIIPLSEIPESLKQATIAIEDKHFYIHPGFDVTAIFRALRENMSGRSFQGASTITQQLIRSSLLTNEVTLTRKIKEAFLAAWAERLYSKDEILEMYFNQIPYGGTAWGVQAASELYFGKDVSELTLSESAFLAGITSAPTTYSPFGVHKDLWKVRQREVLEQMVELDYISKEQAQDALSETLAFQEQPIPYKAPHFVEYVKDVLAKEYGLAMVERGGLIVRTSLDLSVQDVAQQIVTEEVTQDSYLNLHNGAALVTDPKNGDILAMVGSKDFQEEGYGKVNITTSLQQPGSSIKVVTYATALSNGFTAATVLEDSPVTYTNPGAPSYSPVNYNGGYMGKVPLRIAVANSLNIPAVKTLHTVGIDKMVQAGKNMGISSWGDPSEYGLSITLGAAEVTMIDMATVYGTLANLGKRVDLNPILEVKDYKNNVYEQKSETPPTRQVLSSGVAFILSDILADNQARSRAFGTNSPLNIPNHTVSVKTGTTDDKRDNWTIGYTDRYVVTVWVGNNDNSPMSPTLASGITGAAPIWNKIMVSLLKNDPANPRVVPEDIVTKQCSGKTEYFLRGTEGNVSCSTFRPLTVNTNSQNFESEPTPSGTIDGEPQTESVDSQSQRENRLRQNELRLPPRLVQ